MNESSTLQSLGFSRIAIWNLNCNMELEFVYSSVPLDQMMLSSHAPANFIQLAVLPSAQFKSLSEITMYFIGAVYCFYSIFFMENTRLLYLLTRIKVHIVLILIYLKNIILELFSGSFMRKGNQF